MAIYHYTQKPAARGEGKSAVASAAYRSADQLYDQRIDSMFDYTRRSGVAHAEIVLPTAAVKQDIQWGYNRQALWNAAESAEKRKDARVAREHQIALPHELNKGQQIVLLRSFSTLIADRYQVAVDFALHRPHKHGDARNFHAHIYATTREVTASGLGAKASIELSDTDRAKKGLPSGRKEIAAMRELWAGLANEHLSRHGIEARIDHRSLEAQGLSRVPTTHLGVAVSGMERRGMKTQVTERIAEQRALEGQRRRERVAELKGLQGEQHAVDASIVAVTAELVTMRREEVLQQQPKPSMEETQRQAREDWLSYRAANKDDSTAEERERHSIERWLAYRQGQALQGDHAPESDQKSEQEEKQKRDRGIDDDFGL